MFLLSIAILAVVNVECIRALNNIGLHQYKNCNVSLDNGMISMNCIIRNKGKWDFKLFRDWTLKLDNISSISVSINCNYEGYVYLQNPIRAKKLEKLEITNCFLKNFYTYNFTDVVIKLPDTLEEFTMNNCNLIVDIAQIIKLLQGENYEKKNKFFPCHFSPSLRRYTERNELVFYENKEASRNYQESLKERAMYTRPVCEYTYLQYYEQTGTYVLNQNLSNHQNLKYFVDYSKFPALEVLNISNLRLTEIPKQLYEDEWWVWFRNLKIIDMSYNDFNHIVFKYPKPSHHRTILIVNMTRNNISDITGQDLRNIKSFYPNIVNLRNNPFKCTCNMATMMEILKSESDQEWTSAYTYLNDTKCIDQSSDKTFHKLSTLNKAELCPTGIDKKNDDLNITDVYLPLFIALCISLCIFTVFIMTRFRKILIHSRISGVSPIHIPSPVDVKTTVKDFDAFVSYSSRDEDWVLNVLCQKLESPPFNFNLCLHHKHFVPGAYIADNIIESVEKSRHTIMVLSNNFLSSEWCLLEFRKAFHQSLLESSHLIIILLDDNLCLNASPDLKHCLNTRTYIKVSETLFWDKLAYSLSNRRKQYTSKVKSRNNSQDCSTTTSQSIEETSSFLQSK